MLPTRADFYSAADAVQTVFSDISLSFLPNPVTGYLGQVFNENAIAQMMQCLVLTEEGSWPFEPQNGSTVSHSTFEPNDPFTQSMLITTIQSSLTKNAPQVRVVGVQILPTGYTPLGAGTNANYAVQIIVAFQIQQIPGTFTTAISSPLYRIR